MAALSRPAITSAITITTTDGIPSSVDAVSEDMVTSVGDAVDDILLAVVESYEE